MHGYTHDKDNYLKRLRRIEGQVRGLQRMIDEDKYCIDILTQVSAATKALQSVALGLARATFSTIRRNLAWAFGYNVAAIPLAALGFLNPVVASAAMTLSSVFVVANSLRLQRYPLRPASGERPGRRHAQ